MSVYDVVEEYDGSIHQGISRDTFWFYGEDHRKKAKQCYKECKDKGYNVYNLESTEGWEDEHNKVESHSRFGYR